MPSITASSATQVVAIIAATGCVENMITKITRGKEEDTLKDLAQDIYTSLLQDKKVVEIFNENHINYYVARIIMNNIASSTSHYFRVYRKPLLRTDPLEGELLRTLINKADFDGRGEN